MKRKLVFIIIPCLFIITGSFAYAQQREARPVTFRKISDRLYETMGGQGAQGGVYIGDTGVLVIDAKMDKQSVDQVIDQIHRITDKPILYLIDTHSDADHVRGNRFFPGSVTIIGHENCRAEFFHTGRDGSPSEWNTPELAPFIPSITFRDKMDIYLGSKKIELRYFGIGHTTGDIVVYFPEEKTAFVGDQLTPNRPQLIHAYKGGSSFGHVSTLKKMLDTLDAEHFCSGHSEMTDREGVRSAIEAMTGRQEKVKSLMSSGKSIEEIKKEFDDQEKALVEIIYNEAR
ncbi:MBL fold metallo-hydrolase [bacterium]|nr:MBL fold metallo-hydrolase [bacterium]